MTDLKIAPINAQTQAGWSATVTHISPFDEDCFIGEAQTPSGLREVSWNASGIMRGGPALGEGNLSLKASKDLRDLRDAIEGLRKFRPK